MNQFGPPNLRLGLDGSFFLAAVALAALGICMVASASVAATGASGEPAPLAFVLRQIIFLGVGIVLCTIMLCVPLQFCERYRNLLWLAGIALLLLVYVPGLGRSVNGALRWLDLGVFRVQASEPARLLFLIWLAGYVVKRQYQMQTTFMGFILPWIGLVPFAGLFMLEPDLGATGIIVVVSFFLLFLAGAKPWHLLLMLAAALALFSLAMLTEYRRRRFLSYLNPFESPQDGGYQLIQSLMAIKSGGYFGVGFGNSIQKLNYLPEKHTDFIFAIFSEEFGVVGIVVLIALFGVLVWRGFVIGAVAERLERRFAAYLCYALSAWLATQALINLGVNLGLLPTKGLTLPLVSYGGSSLATVSVMLGLIFRVDYENRDALAVRPTAHGLSARDAKMGAGMESAVALITTAKQSICQPWRGSV